MRSEWRVGPRPIQTKKGIKVYYCVYRLKDADKPVGDGNIETSGNAYATYQEAQERAYYMNTKEDPEEVLKNGIERR